MNFLLISGRLPSHLEKLVSNLNLPQRENLVTVLYTDCRAASSPKSMAIYLNRPENSISPVFPSDTGYFEGHIVSEAVKVSEFEMVVITVLSTNREDAELLAIHATSFVHELSKN